MDLGHLGLQSQLSLLSRTSAVNCLRILHLVRTTILVVPSTCPLGSWAKKWEICAYHNNTNLFIFSNSLFKLCTLALLRPLSLF